PSFLHYTSSCNRGDPSTRPPGLARDDSLDVFIIHRLSFIRPPPRLRPAGVHAYASFSKGYGAQASFIVHRLSFIIHHSSFIVHY
ncbi:MAG: hypothetical protein WDA41_08200, partial [Candidatus Neomarinimicrobiota bacterium]